MPDAKFWSDMIWPAIPWAEKIIRPVVVYLALVVLLRIFGKRELAQLNPFDLVVLLTLSNTVQNAIIGDDNSVTGGLVGALVLLGVNWLVVRILFTHERLDRLVEGEADVLIDGGRLQTANLKRELITVAELETAAHKQGFASLAEVEKAVLEPGGGITFVGRRPQPEEARHNELLERIDRLTAEVSALRARG